MQAKTKKSYCFKQYISHQYLTVLTLKHKYGPADFDLHVFTDQSLKSKVAASTGTGAGTELAVLPNLNRSQYVYIYVNNYTDAQGQYDFYIDHIDVWKIANEAFISAGLEFIAEEVLRDIFDINNESNEAVQDDANRAAVALISQLQGKSLSGTTEDLLINEVRRVFAGGNGFVSSFMTNFSVGLIKRIYLRT
jgi:hypothetical protein